MRIYISGKITGLPEAEVKAKFEQAEVQIKAFGHDPINPLKNGLPETAPWVEQMGKDVELLLSCEAVYLLGDWETSPGARIEVAVAKEYGLEVIEQPNF